MGGNLPCRKIPNNIHRHSALKVVKHNFPLLKCRLHIETFFKEYHMEGGMKKEQFYRGET